MFQASDGSAGYLTNRFLPDKDGTRDCGATGGKTHQTLKWPSKFLRPWNKTIQERRLAFLSKNAFSMLQTHHITNYIEWEEMKWCVSKYFLGLVHHNPRISKSTHEFPNKQKEHRHASYKQVQKKMTSSWRLSWKYCQIHLNLPDHPISTGAFYGAARQGSGPHRWG